LFSISVKAAAPSNGLIFALQPHDAKKFSSKEFESNIVMRLSRAIETDVEVYECPWARCVRAVENGDADIIDELFYSVDRDESIYFLKPHYAEQSAGFRFFADNTRVKSITQWADLNNLKIGMLRGYKHFPAFDNAKKLQKFDFLEVDKIVNLILKGRLDVFIAPPSFDENSFKKIDKDGKLVQQPYSHIENLPLFLGISRKSPWFQKRLLLEKKLQEVIE
jgi:polar amino acid transport system substrate-binding protein